MAGRANGFASGCAFLAFDRVCGALLAFNEAVIVDMCGIEAASDCIAANYKRVIS
jgi:hypothetical protein